MSHINNKHFQQRLALAELLKHPLYPIDVDILPEPGKNYQLIMLKQKGETADTIIRVKFLQCSKRIGADLEWNFEVLSKGRPLLSLKDDIVDKWFLRYV